MAWTLPRDDNYIPVAGGVSSTDPTVVLPIKINPVTGRILSEFVGSIVTSVFWRTWAVVATAWDYTATQITNTPAWNIAATTVQAAINELDTETVHKTWTLTESIDGLKTFLNDVKIWTWWLTPKFILGDSGDIRWHNGNIEITPYFTAKQLRIKDTTSTNRVIIDFDNGNTKVNNIIPWFTTTATAWGTTTLTVTSTGVQEFTGTLSQTLVLPVTSTLTTGHSFRVINNSTGSVTINSSWGNLVATLLSWQNCDLVCILASWTTAASWEVFNSGSGGTITTKDEGSTLSTTVTTLDFVGGGVTASGAGVTTTVTIPLAKTPTYIVATSWGDFTTIQGAIDAATSGWDIFISDGTWAVPAGGILLKNNFTYIRGNGEGKCILTYDGATITTAIKWNVTTLKQCGLSGFTVNQTNVTIQGTAIDFSNIALSKIENVQVKDSWVALKMNDTANNTFYNKVNRLMAFGCARGIEINGISPANHNSFKESRIANKSGGDYGIYITNWQGNHFEDMSLEPVATTGNTGIYLTGANAYSNLFENMWIEGNNVWVTIDSSVTYNSFVGGTITANTTNRTDNGKNTAWFNTQVGSTNLTVIQPFSAVDTGNASSTVITVTNNTSFAHVSSGLVKFQLLNASDTSDVLQIVNAWSGAMIAFASSNATLSWTAVVWTLESDTTRKLYYTHSLGERGVLDAEQYITLTSTYTLTSQTAAQKLFNSSTNGALTVKGSTLYRFNCRFSLSAMSASSWSFGFALWGTATLTSVEWRSIANKAALATAATPQVTKNNTAANTAIATATTNTVWWAEIDGVIRTNAGGTIIPQVSLGVAAPAVIDINSSFRIWAIWTNTDTKIGNWS